MSESLLITVDVVVGSVFVVVVVVGKETVRRREIISATSVEMSSQSVRGTPKMLPSNEIQISSNKI